MNPALFIVHYQPLIYGSRSEWHSDKMTRSVKSTRCVTLVQQQNDTVRHFGTVCHFGTEGHFGTAKKCLSLIFFSIFILGF